MTAATTPAGPDSIPRSVFLHLLPGAVQVIVFTLLAPLLMSAGYPAGLAFIFTNIFVGIPLMLGYLKLALRLLAKSRGFSAVAIVTFGITIGVNSAIFSLIEGGLLRPAVPSKPKEVVCIFTGSRDAERSFRHFSYAEFVALPTIGCGLCYPRRLVSTSNS